MTKLRPFSTKVVQPVPPEFEAQFIRGGHLHVQHLYGKNPAQRYFTALGADRLRAARKNHQVRQEEGASDAGSPIPLAGPSCGV